MANLSEHISDETRDVLQQIADAQRNGQQKPDRTRMLEEIVRRRIGQGLKPDDQWLRWRCPDADVLMMHGLAKILGERAQWLPEYDEVADWLADNRGKGLMCIGNVGRGKSLLTCDIIPMIFDAGYVTGTDGYRLARPLVCTARELPEHWREVERCRIIVVDEVGQEGVVNDYGQHRDYFDELVMIAERQHKTLILSSNLTKEELFGRAETLPDGTKRFVGGRYSDQRIRDRLTSTTRRVAFVGDSLRRQTRKG